ncbi:uncharacterized protein LOC101859044 [Aplysia californica]|uniref:Uncharacterized protein LOC101859044 n=1 Tax=Aplysia californica TaxID=6500 RepID=A0ABM1W0V7_APLCA|nr:uncharacterized protein LOC101859044 [Aplysia californica]
MGIKEIFLCFASFAALVAVSNQQQQCVGQLDIVFAIDGSNSMSEQRFNTQISSLVSLFQTLPISESEVHVGSELFSRVADPSDSIPLTGDVNSLITRISAYLHPDENTATDLGIMAAIRNFQTYGRQNVPKLLMVITDGESDNTTATVEQAQAAKNMGINIYALGVTDIGSNVNQDELRLIASAPNQVLLSSNFNELAKTLVQATSQACVNLDPPVVLRNCDPGTSDLWLVVDVSQGARTRSANFADLISGLKEPVVDKLTTYSSNPNFHAGVITYNDNYRVDLSINTPRSAQYLSNTIGNIGQFGSLSGGNARLNNALASVVSAPVNSQRRSYVVIVAGDNNNLANDRIETANQIRRLKNLGWYIVTVAVGGQAGFDSSEFLNYASGRQYFYQANNYETLDDAMVDFYNDWYCNAPLIPTTPPPPPPTTPAPVIIPSAGLCAAVGSEPSRVLLVPHPLECDKFVQCYYNPSNAFELGVVRQCPMGLHWNRVENRCTNVTAAQCPYDPCMVDCEPYAMEGSCAGFWQCSEGVSVPKCCDKFFSFVPGVGCQLDFSCKQYCGPENCSSHGICHKRPIWEEKAAYEVGLGNGLMGWMPRPCFFEDFDIVDCDCTAPRAKVCPADRAYDFTNRTELNQVVAGTREGIEAVGVNPALPAATLAVDSSLNIKVNPMETGYEPFVLQMRFREASNFNKYGAVLVSSGQNCEKGGGTLLITATADFIQAEIDSRHGPMAKVKVPTKGIARNQIKDLTLSYANNVLALSVKGNNQQYIGQVSAPSHICFRCGLNVGSAINSVGFQGVVEKISVHSCTPSKLY